MSLMDPSTEVGLFAPPFCITVVFILGWNISRASAGRVSRVKAKALATYCLALLAIGYAIIWWREIKSVWLNSPVLTVFSAVGIASAIGFLIVDVAKNRDLDGEGENCLAVQQKRLRSLSGRIFSWITIVWGVLGLVGGVWAIVRIALTH